MNKNNMNRINNSNKKKIYRLKIHKSLTKIPKIN